MCVLHLNTSSAVPVEQCVVIAQCPAEDGHSLFHLIWRDIHYYCEQITQSLLPSEDLGLLFF